VEVKGIMNREHVEELLYQALETEMGGVQVYETAILCAMNDDLKEEWEEYLRQTKEHVQKVQDILESVGLDVTKETPGRKVVRGIGEALVAAMESARKEGERAGAELVAAECVVLAETKDHMNWELIGEIVKNGGTDSTDVMKKAHSKVEDEEDEHLYHTMGWARELWMKSLGLRAVIPPPEEKRDVKTMMQAARAKQSRDRIRSPRAKAARSSKARRSSSSKAPGRRRSPGKRR
jgi:ferritin-like metal-binding protein YciE